MLRKNGGQKERERVLSSDKNDADNDDGKYPILLGHIRADNTSQVVKGCRKGKELGQKSVFIAKTSLIERWLVYAVVHCVVRSLI